jgi:hypothetical protein
MNRLSEDTPRINLYDGLFERHVRSGKTAGLAIQATVEAYLDGKPAARGKQKYTRHQRDSAFWSSRFVSAIPDDAWHSYWLTLALARYLGQEPVANPSLLERIATTAPRVVHRATRYSGLVLEQHSPRRTELDRIAASSPDIAELCRILDIFNEAYLKRLATVETWKRTLAKLSPFELLIYASLYAFEPLIPGSLAAPSMPADGRNVAQEQWQAINDLLIWKLKTTPTASLRTRERDLGRWLKKHLSPYLLPSPDGPPPRHDLREAFETLLDAQIELKARLYGKNARQIRSNRPARTKCGFGGRNYRSCAGSRRHAGHCGRACRWWRRRYRSSWT